MTLKFLVCAQRVLPRRSGVALLLAIMILILLANAAPANATPPTTPGDTHEPWAPPLPTTLTLQSQPPGLQVKFDNQTLITPAQVQSAPGSAFVLFAVSPQQRAGKTFVFRQWLHGGCAAHAVVTPSGATAYTALFRVTKAPVSTIGVFRPSQSTFHLRSSNTTGPATLSQVFGTPTDLPVVGDWNGDGIDTIGVFRPSNGMFMLRDSNAPGAPLAYSIAFGGPGDLPVVGDWDGNGRDGIGVYRPALARFFLKNTLVSGIADVQMTFGAAGDLPVSGDWNADGVESPGLYRPSAARFLLTNQVCSCAPGPDHQISFGASSDLPFTGDWNGDGVTGVGVYRPSQATMFLRNDPTTTGFADITLSFGANGDRPIAGNWGLDTNPPQPAPENAPTFEPPKN